MHKSVGKREVILVKGPLFDQVLKNAYVAANKIIRRKLASQTESMISERTANR